MPVSVRSRLRRSLGAAVTAATLALAGGVVASPLAQADTPWTVTDPGGMVSAQVTLSGSGELGVTAKISGTTVLTVAKLGLVTSAGDLSTGLTVTSSSVVAVNEHYQMLVGKAAQRDVQHNELLLQVTKGSLAFTVAIRASHDGIAWNYRLPGTGAFANGYTVNSDPAKYTLPTPAATAWVQPFEPEYENDHQVTTVSAAGTGSFGFPGLFRTAGASTGPYVFLTESNVTGTYAASHLTHTSGSATYGLELYQNTPVVASGALATPWRIALLGGLPTIVESTMVDDLATPSHLQGTDTSWIQPGSSAWSWNTNRSSQSDLAMQKRYVDLAARNGWKYTVLDEGWKVSWVQELVRYAQARGVEVIVWFHWSDSARNNGLGGLRTVAERKAWFDRLTQWGVKGIKVDFMESDGQATFQWYDDILADTAEYHLMVNFHGATLPKGIQRSWPQIMSYEGVRGEENGRSAQRNTILPFTRNVVGSMDYTPVVFDGNTQTSKAQELALPVLYESAWTHYADKDTAYAAEPIAERFLQQVPTTWDQTTLIAGDPGVSTVMARRSGENWFIGGIRNGSASTLSVPLGVLGAGNWLIHLVTDNGSSLSEEVRQVTSSDVLSLSTVANGGFALEACPAVAGRTDCYQSVTTVPTTSTSVTADKTTLSTGDVVTVGAVFQVATGGVAQSVRLAPELPATWRLISGSVATSDLVRPGESLSGTWKVQVGSGGPRGTLDIPVAATYATTDGREIRSAGAATVTVSAALLSGEVAVSALGFASTVVGYGSLTRDADFNGQPLNMLSPSGVDTVYPRGIEVNAISTVKIDTLGACTRFTADLGLETSDSNHPDQASINVEIRDQAGTVLASAGTTSAPLKQTSPGVAVDVDITGVQQLVLYVGDGGLNGINSDHGVFGNPVLHCATATDAIAPTVTLSTTPTAPTQSGLFAQSAALRVESTDPDSDEVTTQVRVDGGSWQTVTGDLAVGEGSHLVEARAVDAGGNVSAIISRTVKVDVTAPVVAADIDATARTVTLGASDTGSGVVRLEYQVGTSAWATYAGPIRVGAGAAKVSFRATDLAGLTSGVAAVTVPAAGSGSAGTSLAALASARLVFGSAGQVKVKVAGGTGSGTVTIREGATVLGRVAVRNHAATLTLPKTLSAGRHALVVAFTASSG